MEKYKDSIREYAYCFILGPFFMIIEACGEFILPYLNANIIDKGAANGDIPFILQNGLYMLVTALIMLAGGLFCHQRFFPSGCRCAGEGVCSNPDLFFCQYRCVFYRFSDYPDHQ